MAAALVAAPVIRWVDDRTRWELLGFGPGGATALLGAISASLLTFVVFSFSILLLAVQVAGGQLTPRIIGRVFESRLTKATLGAFVFSYVYSLASLGRMEGRVPQLPVLVAVLLSLGSIALFIFLIQVVSLGFRPVTVLTRVGEVTKAAIDSVYPHPFADDDREGDSLEYARRSAAPRTITHRGGSGTVFAFDADRLAGIATQAGCSIEFVPRIGDSLAAGEELFRLWGPGADVPAEERLRRCVVLGPEGTPERDPVFGFRILVEIASKALSPAINDPATAVLALDQLHHLLFRLGRRRLDEGVLRDGAGEVRLVYRTPGWVDFVTLAVTEIRLYGATSPQVPRRIRAMLEHLAAVLPPSRGEALRGELALLERTVERSYADPEDRAMASVPDLQGFGSRQYSLQEVVSGGGS
jgi:uncharacterized membrane protein